MLGQKNCPFCHTPALRACAHLALTAEARDFVRHCIEVSNSTAQWRTLCSKRRGHLQRVGEWAPEREDFTWLETAFCDEFLKPLRWFGGMDYEWRAGTKPGQGGFHVLLWSQQPQRLWWELQDALERLSAIAPSTPSATMLSTSPPPQSLFTLNATASSPAPSPPS